MEYKKLLLPIDWRCDQPTTIKFAENMVQPDSSEIILVHIIDSLSDKDSKKDYLLSEKCFESWTEALTSKGYSVKNWTIAGKVEDEINWIAEQMDCDLIIIENKPKTEHGRRLKTITSKILETSKIPVLIIPENFEIYGFNRVVIGIDPELESVKELIQFSKITNNIHCIISLITTASSHNSEAANQNLNQLRDQIRPYFPNNIILTDVIDSGNTSKALIEFSENTDADLLILFTHRRDLMEKVLDSSISKLVTNECKIPVLTIPIQKEPVFFL